MTTNIRIDSVQRQPFHRVHRGFFVGLFTLTSVFLIVLSLVYTVGKHEMFQDWHTLHVVYESSYGLGQGDIVTISDIRVGDVTRVTLTQDGRAQVTFRILTRHAHLVRKNSRVMLRQKNILTGDWLIALTQGNIAVPAVEENDTLVGEPPMRMDKVIGQLTSMIGTFESILTEVDEGRGFLGDLVRGDSLFNAVHGAVKRLGMFAEAGGVTAGRFDKTAIKFGELSDTYVGLADSVNRALTTVEPAILEAKSLLTELRSTGAHVTPALEQALKDLQELEVLLKGLQKHWLFRRAIRKSQQAESEQEPVPQ